MSYENAVPKPLKFLISDGKMIDDQGNVIAESETLKDLYTKWNPEVKKYLLSDGSVVDEEGNLIVKNDYYKKIYDQADPKVAKYLHADGTIDENPGGGGGADLEDNHQTTIDVSTYTQPVEVTPTAGKDGMKKNTVTLNNIPSGSGTAYAWQVVDSRWPEQTDYNYLSASVAPANKDELFTIKSIMGDVYAGNVNIDNFIPINVISIAEYTRTSDTEFAITFTVSGTTITKTFTRNSTKDFTLWQLSE